MDGSDEDGFRMKRAVQQAGGIGTPLRRAKSLKWYGLEYDPFQTGVLP